MNVFGSLIENALKNVDTPAHQVEVGQANIKVIGCGGGGTNATNWLFKKGIQGAEIVAINTDKQHLDLVEADKKILVGRDLTRGLGCGGFPDKGREAAKEQLGELKEVLRGTDMVFITAGMGGGTGTGFAPVVAQLAKEEKAIVIGAVTMPFEIERARIETAESDYKNRVEEAVKRALSNPLLEVSYDGATGALIHVAGGDDLTLDEVNRVGNMITQALDEDANVIWGARISGDMKGKLRVMTIITGVNSPYIMGKGKAKKDNSKAMSRDLGIDFF